MQYLKICCIAYCENLGTTFNCLQLTFLKIWCNLAKNFGRYAYCLKNRFFAITSQKIGPQSLANAKYSIKLFYTFYCGNTHSTSMYNCFITKKLSKKFLIWGKFFFRNIFKTLFKIGHYIVHIILKIFFNISIGLAIAASLPILSSLSLVL